MTHGVLTDLDVLIHKIVRLENEEVAMSDMELTYNTRKALCVHIGEPAGIELANLLRKLIARVEQLEKSKVDVTPVAPKSSANLLEAGYARDIS